ncbi:glycosyltransferase family 2 protein [Gelidibacter salicanalis]|uniref:Glycosyltransferase family 2 protein n=1 Tax=Gelidibacter salicanalis TaxID=291193 RepID=A0A5C7ANX0_9FLAO|nr:glycosyltransferase family 2 protein [Gelidibacter salicanalis]TXE09273.1 glycosyltransferase family 2 protein [Gelidibacter salicanalis]
MNSSTLLTPPKTPLVYTIIVTYNGMQWIDQCLKSLRESSIPTHVIVIDNLSTDDSAKHIGENFPEVHLIRSKINLGFGKGNNIGLTKALKDNVDYVFLLNQDAWVRRDSIELLINIHRNNNDYGVLSPVHLNGTEKELETKFAEYAGPENTPGFLSDLYMQSIKPLYTSNFVNAAAWLISKKCLEKVGGFNPLFAHYGEDEDYINRVKYWGFKIGIVPNAVITHDSIFSWEKIEFHPVRNVIFNLVPLADINNRYRSAWLAFIKKSMDELTGQLLFRKFKRFKTRHKAFWNTITKFQEIKKARENSKHQAAFL